MRRSFDEPEVQETPKGFDLTTHRRDPKTGLVIESDPYILRILGGTDGGKSRVWERPAGSGNLWDKSNQPIGRWDKTQPEGKRFIAGAPHVEWTPPETKDQKLARSLVEKESKINELERELAAIKAEEKKKTPTPAQKKDQGA